MVDIEIADREIKELEARGDTTYSLCEKLAMLYTVRDHLSGNETRLKTPATPEGGSDFLKACASAGYERTLEVLDEAMQTLKVVQPRFYDSVMDKIARGNS